jgi:hypothetical protein
VHALWIDNEEERLKKEGGREGGREAERNTGKFSYACTKRAS